MKYSTTILLLIGAISLEESQAIELSKRQSHFEEAFGEKTPKGHKKKSGKGHKGKKHGTTSSSSTTDSAATSTQSPPASSSDSLV
tara:strand:+ start:98 stop:352 length:255 start_codon:yes stop_codon:yes gene_type:complete